MKQLLILLILALSACGSTYKYSHIDADGAQCSVTIVSNRDLVGGELNIGPDCNITSGAEDLRVNEKAYEAVNKTLDVLKMLAIP